MKLAKPYRYLYRDIDARKRERWRLRAPGKPTLTIKGKFGSPEFAANYRAAMEREVVPTITTKHGTIEALGRSYLKSAAFAQLAAETKRKRRWTVEQFCSSYGNLPVAQLQREHVKRMMDGFANKPGTGRNFLSMLRVLMALAIDDGTRDDDPTAHIKRPRLSHDGWHTWTEDEIAQYEAKHPVGSQARLALALALYTGQRACDLAIMGRQHVDGGKISVAQHKTGVRLWVPIHHNLKAIIDATPSAHLTFLISGMVGHTPARTHSATPSVDGRPRQV